MSERRKFDENLLKERFIRTFRQIERNSKEFGMLNHVLQNFVKFRRNVNKTSARKTTNLTENCDNKFCDFSTNMLTIFAGKKGLSGAKVCTYCRSRQELSDEYLIAKIGVNTADNEPSEILKFGCRPTTDRGPCRRPLRK